MLYFIVIHNNIYVLILGISSQWKWIYESYGCTTSRRDCPKRTIKKVKLVMIKWLNYFIFKISYYKFNFSNEEDKLKQKNNSYKYEYEQEGNKEDGKYR